MEYFNYSSQGSEVTAGFVSFELRDDESLGGARRERFGLLFSDGLSLLPGFTRPSALLVILLLGVSFGVHNFWKVQDQQAKIETVAGSKTFFDAAVLESRCPRLR